MGTWPLHSKVMDNQFDLYMQVDTNTNGHRQWFFYSVRNRYSATVKFNIFRFRKRFSLFQRGMKPYICSVKDGGKWVPGGNKIKYRVQCRSSDNPKTKYYYLSFEYTFEYSEDEVFFSAGIPYTYSYLQKRLNSFSTEAVLQNFKQNNINFIIGNIGKSLCGLEIPFIRIQPKTQQPKKYIIISARTHPGQFSSSWVMDGILQKFIDSPNILLWMNQNCIGFQIVPMMNPDGVFVGNYRTGIIGDDFNRKFSSGRKQLFPEIFYLRKIINDCKKLGQIYMYLDLHGHSILRNSFIYGPVETLFTKNPLRNLAFSLWNASRFFQFSSCKFRFQKDLAETARVHFQFKLNILTYTLQTSLGLYEKSGKSIQMTQQNYQELGSSVLISISELMIRSKLDKEALMPLIRASSKKNTSLKPQTSEEKSQKKINKLKNGKVQTDHRYKNPKVIQKQQKETSTKTKEALSETAVREKFLTSKLKLKTEESKDTHIPNTPIFAVTNKKISHKDKKVIDQSGVKYKIRKKQDILKTLLQPSRKKKLTKTKEEDDNSSFQFERSITHDAVYLSSQMPTNQHEQNDATNKDEQVQGNLEIIDEKFSEEYSSINDQDSSSEDLEPQKKQYLIECIRNNRKLDPYLNENFEAEEMVEQSPEKSMQFSKINRFKEIQFKSVGNRNANNQTNKTPKKDMKKFREAVHKSLNRSLYNIESDLLNSMNSMAQKKNLNDRLNRKGQRQPYFLVQIKNKYK